MARRVAWLREVRRMTMLYLAAGAAFVPSGVVYALLALAGWDGVPLAVICLAAGFFTAHVVWRGLERPKAPEQIPERYINRWWRVVGGLSMNLALGSLYAWSVFVRPLEQEFGWKRADVSTVFTIAVFVFGLSFILAGRMQDKLGPTKISIIGGLLVSIGFFACAYVNSLNAFFFWFGVMGGVGNGFGYATPIPVMSKWFPDKRGLAVGLAVAGYGGGSAIFGPLAGNWLIPTYGWRTTFTALAVIFLVMTMFGAFLLQNPPAGYRPAGWTPAPAPASSYEFAPAEMLRTHPFYFMWVAYALGCSAGLMLISQLVPFARSQGHSIALATTALFVGAVGNFAGRAFSGSMSHALGRLNVLRLMIAVSAVAMPLLSHRGSNLLDFYLLVFVVYYCYGAQLSVNASTTADFWGTKYVGPNYGLVFTAWGVAGIIGPRMGGGLYDAYGNYYHAFYTAGLLAALALVAEVLAKPPAMPIVGPVRA